MTPQRFALALPLIVGMVFAGVATAHATPLITPSYATLPPASHPVALAGASDGSVYSANSDGTISSVDSHGVLTARAFDFGPTAHLCAMTIDDSGDLWVVNSGSGTVSIVNPGWGSVRTYGAPVTGAIDCAITRPPGSASPAYIVTDLVDSVTSISEVGVVDAAFGVLPPGAAPRAIAFDSSGSLYTANSGLDTVSRITASGAVTADFAALSAPTGTVEPRAIAVDSRNNVVVAGYASGSISRITPTGTVTPVVELDPSAQPRSLAMNAMGDLLYVDESDSSVSLIPGDGSAPSVLFDRPDGNSLPAVTADRNGAITVADATTNELMRIDLGARFRDTPTGPIALVTGVPFSYRFEATGNEPFTFRVPWTPSIPDGLSFDPATGILSGTPTKTGTFRVGFEVSNALSKSEYLATFIVTPGVRPAPHF
ncbi:putative Ig domain-containing protein [Herbiconiux sp.]|uniref:Vgb family protein n=1 Tax=Herbiconiux sp. TaxID=1871186 RepID=UPI0025BD6790|nr:putative Ig domain-containing protein [Herbiconiux sp.]